MRVQYWPTRLRRPLHLGLIVLALVISVTSAQVVPGRKPLPSVHLRYPNFGAAFDAPDGYLSAPATDVGEIVRMVGENGPERALVVATVPVGDQTLGNYVAELRANTGWRDASEAETTLDGEKAIRVGGGKSRDEALVEAVLAKHGRYIFLIARHMSDSAAAKRDLEIVRSTWKWLPFENPVRRLVFVDDSASLFDGRVTLPMPVVMRPFRGEGHPKFGIYDYERGVFVMIVDVQSVSIAKELSFDEMKARFSGQLHQRMSLKEHLAWREVKGKNRTAVTQTFEGKALSGAAGKSHFQMAVARLEPKTWLLFTLTLTGVDTEERQQLEKAFNTMLERYVTTNSISTPARN